MSTIKVNTVETRTGSTLTLGKSGDTVSIASGASTSGMGRAGAVDWQTTIKTGDFSASDGEGYFVDTSSGTITATLPSSPSAGAIVAFKDYAQNFGTNALTINRNGSNIEGTTDNQIINGTAESVTFVFADSTKGWVLVNESTTRYGPLFVQATGGNSISCSPCGNFKIHTFTSPGTFTVTCAGSSGGSNAIDYLVVAGGGGSPVLSESMGGGGAGGFRESQNASFAPLYTASPLKTTTSLNLPATGYPITVGAGGAAGSGPPCTTGSQGSSSVFSTITSAGGGHGGQFKAAGGAGGSGGGGGGRNNASGGAGNTPPVTPAQGNNGGSSNPPNNGPEDSSGGGGGATAVGGCGTTPQAGNGGAGATTSINGTPNTFAGGGGGGTQSGCGGAGGSGGGGRGGSGSQTAQAGTVNTGGGAGGKAAPPGTNGDDGLSGGSGIVIIRYKFQ